MKHATLIFLKVTSGLYQQRVFGKEKKDFLAKKWSEAVEAHDLETMRALITEVKLLTNSRLWLKELTEIENEAVEGTLS